MIPCPWTERDEKDALRIAEELSDAWWQQDKPRAVNKLEEWALRRARQMMREVIRPDADMFLRLHRLRAELLGEFE